MEELILDENEIYNKVVKPCKKGLFIAILVTKENNLKILKNILNLYLSEKRGIFSYSGIVVLFNDINNIAKDFFDLQFFIKE